MQIQRTLLVATAMLFSLISFAQESRQLTLDRIYNSREFSGDWQGPVRWIENGEAYVAFEYTSEGLSWYAIPAKTKPAACFFRRNN